MKKTLGLILSVLLILTGLSAPAFARSDDLLMIDVDGGAIMYDSYNLEYAQPFALIPEGSVALRIATLDWGYCVAFGNYVGYIFEEDAYAVDSSYYYFELPTGEDYSLNWSEDDWDAASSVPEFPYDLIDCAGNQKISTRSGPSNNYTSHGSIQVGHEVYALYQTKLDGVEWCYIEFERDNKMYRVFTPLYRVNIDGFLPDDSEDYVWAHIANGHTPRLGPGYDYASADYYVPAYTEVKAYYQQDGWLLYDFTSDDGILQRAWAEPGDWY